MPAFPGIAHIAITVTDLDRSTAWYTRLLGSEPVLDEDETTGNFHHTVYALDGGQLFGLHTHPASPTATFDEHQPGLDHVSFGLRGPRRAGEVGGPAERARHHQRGHRRRPLRLGCLVPRPRRDRARVLRAAGSA